MDFSCLENPEELSRALTHVLVLFDIAAFGETLDEARLERQKHLHLEFILFQVIF